MTIAIIDYKPTFDPIAKTLDFGVSDGYYNSFQHYNNNNPFTLDKLIFIQNTRTQEYIFTPLIGATLSGQILTLNYDTSLHNANDVLSVKYEIKPLAAGVATSYLQSVANDLLNIILKSNKNIFNYTTQSIPYKPAFNPTNKTLDFSINDGTYIDFADSDNNLPFKVAKLFSIKIIRAIDNGEYVVYSSNGENIISYNETTKILTLSYDTTAHFSSSDTIILNYAFSPKARDLADYTNQKAILDANGNISDTAAINSTSSWSIISLLKGLFAKLSGTILVDGSNVTQPVNNKKSTGVAYGVNRPTLPVIGANFDSGTYTGYLLIATVPANLNRLNINIENLSAAPIVIIRDDGTASTGNAPANPSVFSLEGGNVIGRQGGAWSSNTFTGRLQVYSQSSTAQVEIMED